MNILTGIVIIIFLLFMIRGYRRGLIKSLASVISLVASLALVSFVTPYVSQFLQEQTPGVHICYGKMSGVLYSNTG